MMIEYSLENPMPHLVSEILLQFQLEGRLIDVALYGSGHIHDTFLSRYLKDGRETRYIHQWINHFVFKQPDKVMENIVRVTEFSRQEIQKRGGDPLRETLTLVPTVDGRPYYRSPEGDTWRTYLFVEDATAYDQPLHPGQLASAARAYAQFQRLLSALPGGRLHETIPGFHHTPGRFAAFTQALERDACNRAGSIRPEIDFILQREPQTRRIADLLAKGAIPERVTHNDTKLNNVLIDDRTGQGLCVIDLDTVMPGSALYDFGDSVRMGASTAVEDEPELAKVSLNLEAFEALAAGYLEEARQFLIPAEIDQLVFSARLITLEQAIRFLGDYLNGDIYYRTHRPAQNLDRARTQIKMLQEMEAMEGEMERIVQRYQG